MLLFAAMLTACPSRSVDDALPAFSKAYDGAFRRLGTIELSDTQARVQALGDAGQGFGGQLAELRRRQGEISDLLVKAVELKKKGVADRQAAAVDEATRVLGEADAKAARLGTDLEALERALTAAGAPPTKRGPPRDPNARD